MEIKIYQFLEYFAILVLVVGVFWTNFSVLKKVKSALRKNNELLETTAEEIKKITSKTEKSNETTGKEYYYE